MSKRAEQAALKAYPGQTKEHSTARFFFADGYEQAEKDLALIPEDIGVIFNLVLQCQTKYSATSGCYQEVLELFNKARNGEA